MSGWSRTKHCDVHVTSVVKMYVCVHNNPAFIHRHPRSSHFAVRTSSALEAFTHIYTSLLVPSETLRVSHTCSTVSTLESRCINLHHVALRGTGDSCHGRLQATHWSVRAGLVPLFMLLAVLIGDHRFINNEWVEGVDKKTFEVINPTTEEVICSVSEATEKDVDSAVSAARKAFKTTWRQTTPQQRGIYLTKLADIAEKNAELLAAVESLDNGKTISFARIDIAAVIGCIRYYGGWADKIGGKTIDVNPQMFHYTRQEPVSCSPRAFISRLGHSRDLRQVLSLVSAARSSPGTFLCSCWLGKLGLHSRRETRLC